MSPAQYAVESQVAFVRPAHPGALVIPTATARHLADQMEREYKENLCIFHKPCTNGDFEILEHFFRFYKPFRVKF